MVYSCIKDIKRTNSHRTIKFRSYKNFNVDNFLNDIKSSSGYKTIENGHFECVESAWSLWKKSFSNICNSHAPLQIMRVKNRHNPWITPDIIKLMYERDYVHKNACKYNNQ